LVQGGRTFLVIDSGSSEPKARQAAKQRLLRPNPSKPLCPTEIASGLFPSQ